MQSYLMQTTRIIACLGLMLPGVLVTIPTAYAASPDVKVQAEQAPDEVMQRKNQLYQHIRALSEHIRAGEYGKIPLVAEMVDADVQYLLSNAPVKAGTQPRVSAAARQLRGALKNMQIAANGYESGNVYAELGKVQSAMVLMMHYME